MRMSIERDANGYVSAWAHSVGDLDGVSTRGGCGVVLTVSSPDMKLCSAIVFADIPTAERAARALAKEINRAKAAFKERDKDE